MYSKTVAFGITIMPWVMQANDSPERDDQIFADLRDIRLLYRFKYFSSGLSSKPSKTECSNERPTWPNRRISSHKGVFENYEFSKISRSKCTCAISDFRRWHVENEESSSPLGEQMFEWFWEWFILCESSTFVYGMRQCYWLWVWKLSRSDD